MLYISAHKAAIYHWQGGDLGSSYLFDGNEEGRAYFERYLRETPKAPIYLLTDFFEEEYRQDTIPHVLGPDRKAILQRKKGRLFRDTPYFYSRVIGREEEGRKDDQVLMTAITNPGLVAPWTRLIEADKIPLAGIYSVPLFSEAILKRLDKPSERLLLVSLQSISGLRQTFFLNKRFRISRLVQMPRYGTEPYVPHIQEEVEKIQRYLSSMRLMSHEEPLQICFMMSSELLEDLKKAYPDSTSSRYEFYDINKLLQSAGSKQTIATPFSDRFFAHQLLQVKPSNFYASSTERRYFTMRNLRFGMLTSSALLLLASAVWSGFNLMGGLSYKQRSLSAQSKSQFYNTRYELARQRLPQTPVEPEDLKVAVKLANKLEQYKSSPLEMIKLISTGADKYPSVKLDSFQWAASVDPNTSLGAKKSAGTPANRANIGHSRISSKDTGYDYYQIALVSGHLDPFDGDYREAIDEINKFVDTLRTTDNVHDVSIVSLPLDVSSNASLQGSANGASKRADFAVRIVLGIHHEA
ncbi:MAG: hypothetical protein P8126_07735 [Gammaproteobacteria bacterium]